MLEIVDSRVLCYMEEQRIVLGLDTLAVDKQPYVPRSRLQDSSPFQRVVSMSFDY